MKKELKLSAKIMRHQLTSIDISDIFKIEKEEERPEDKDLPNDTEVYYNRYFEEVIDTFLSEQLKFTGGKTKTNGEFLYARGTYNGLNLIKEWFERQKNISLARFGNDDEEKDEPETEAVEV